MANKAKSKGREGYAAQYKASRTWEANRKRRLERTLKNQPTNEQVRLALKDINYRRKTPNAPFWSHSMINTAKLFKQFAGKFDKDFFSPDTKKQVVAAQVRSQPTPVSKKKTPHRDSSMFSIETRLANGRQGLTWIS